MSWRLPLALLSALFLLSSCLDLDARLEIGADGESRFRFATSIPKFLSPLAELRPAELHLPFALERAALEAEAEAARGRLLSFSRVEGDEELSVSAELSFPSPEAFAAFLNPEVGRAAYSDIDGRRSLSIPILPGAGLSARAKDILGAASAGRRVSLAVLLPRPVREGGIGRAAAGGRELSYSESSLVLASRGEPLAWEIAW